MAEGSSNTPGPFDVMTVKSLIQMMSRHDISEIDLRQGDQRIRLLRGGTPLLPISPPGDMPTHQYLSSAPLPRKESTPDVPVDRPSKPLYEIKSPTPGTFYAKANPEAEPYVKQGSKVTPDTVVCLIEAMKLFTEINAEVHGVIAEILVQNGQPVEYGTVLFRVDTA